VHQDGVQRPTTLPSLGKVVSPTEDVADRQQKGFLMITRRNYLIGISAALSAPAIVRAQNLMRVRGIVLPIQPKNYYGFCDRLWINYQYQKGELRGSALMRMIDEGLLRHVPPAIVAYDLAKLGTAELSLAAREERRAQLFGHELKCSASRLYEYNPGA
jgi:hypothetical protein